jgi:hypothetical protein
MDDIKLSLGFEIINSYKRLSYKQWYALAEYVDNSTQAYLYKAEILEPVLKAEGKPLTIDISYKKNGDDEVIRIEDNSIGMSFEELRSAVIIGNPPPKIDGRSRYGLGMKTASFWIGNEWTVTTKKLNDTIEHTIFINTNDAVSKHGQIIHSTKENIDPLKHYTIVTISDLNQPFSARTRGKIKEYLRSIYRYDIHNIPLKLIWQGETLEWNYADVFSNFVPMADGKEKIEFDFFIGQKRVNGWGAVIEDGSRTKAGFSVFQNDRVIMGWPSSYKPSSIFGDEGGRNDLINQRLVGELFLNDFTVSHTKDEIIFEKDEEDVLEFELKERLANLMILANQPKKLRAAEILESAEENVEYETALGFLETEFHSAELLDAFETFEIPDEEIILANNKILIENVSEKSTPRFTVKLGALTVNVYIETEISVNDPYLSIAVYSTNDVLDVLINRNHPHWHELTGSESIMNYIRHCVYDGVSEWKAAKYTGQVLPDTVKSIKDNLLRAAYKISLDKPQNR